MKLTSGCLAVAVLVVVILAGCSSREKPWRAVQVNDTQGANPIIVTIVSPPYGKNARPPDVVEVLWDGKSIFNGALPARLAGPDGMPMTLAEIKTTPGPHTIEVRHKGASQKATVKAEQKPKYLMIFHVNKDGKEVLIEELPDDVKFC